MATAQFSEMGAPRRSNESNAPYFRKRLTSAMLKKSERVVIPKNFVLEHGDRIHGVLSLTGPNGNVRSVTLSVRGGRERAIVTYLARGWIQFARENDFQMGDEVIFRLVGDSSFSVALWSSQSGGTSDAVLSEIAPQDPKLERQDLREGTTGCVEAVPRQKQTSKVRREEFAKYAGLNSAVTENSRFPQFVRRLTSCHVNGENNDGPEMPVAFVKEHGDKMREHVTLLGASDHLRTLKLRITTSTGCDRVYLRKGWRDFALENGYSEGDVLLFSLVEMSTFVVKTFTRATLPYG